ncbi:MAG: nucleotidyltransferase domain-containing protein [Anaerolineales bacterium]|nr:nucleotidyltransferase domain-containing protein [Anaerolineales bacterium]
MSILVKTGVAPTGFRPVAETLPGVIERLVEALNPHKIILFGSYAYGQPTPDSDVDLLVVWDAPATRRERAERIAQALDVCFFPMDIVSRTPEEFEQMREDDFFLQEICRRGQVLYERR